jgi:PAS domain S-box-containing protein
MRTNNCFFSKHSLNGDYTYVSDSVVNIIGYEPHELIGKSAYEFFHPFDVRNIVTSHLTVRSSITVVFYRIRNSQNKYLWVKTNSQQIDDEIITFTRKISFIERVLYSLFKINI